MSQSPADILVPLSVVAFCAVGLAVAGQLDMKAGRPPSAIAAITPASQSQARWRAQPDADTALERIGFGSCLVQGRPQPIWSAVIAARPQTFVMMGDNVYGDFNAADGARLEAAYAAQLGGADFQRAFASIPMLATWDDHDYGLNDGGSDFARKAVAARLFETFWAGSGTLDGVRGPGIAYARTFGPVGQRVQFIMLDTRSFRSPLKRKPKDDKAKGRYVPDDDPEKTLLGTAQWAWLGERLSEPADLRLIVSSIQVIADGHRWERWGNLPIQRQKLYALIASTRARNVVFLSGDRHRAGLYRLTTDGGAALVEATSSSMNRSFDDPEESGPHQVGPMFGANNFGLIEIDWEARIATISIRDEAGIGRRATAIALTSGP